MTLYIKDRNNTTIDLLDLINTFSEVSGYIDRRKSVTFQNTNNKHAKEEGRTVPVTENWG